MGYLHSWDANQPLGTANSGTIDDIIRELKATIEERMDTILATGGKWADDPIVLAGGGGGATIPSAYFTQLYGPHHLVVGGSVPGVITDFQNGYVTVEGDGRLPIVIDGESTIQSVIVVVNPAAETVTCELIRGSYLSSATTPIGVPVVLTGVGYQIAQVFSGIEPANAVNTYHVKLNAAGSGPWQLTGMKVITYRSIP